MGLPGVLLAIAMSRLYLPCISPLSPPYLPGQDLLEECKKAERYEAAAEATKVLELMELTGSAMDSDPKAAVAAGDT